MTSTTGQYLQTLIDQKAELAAHLSAAQVEAHQSEVFNTLVDKVGAVFNTPRIEVEYNSEGATAARMFYINTFAPYLFYTQPLKRLELIQCNPNAIGSYAFAKTKLTSFTIPSTVESIGSYAFFESGLTSVTIPGSVKEIGGSCFYYCNSLTSVTLPDTPVTLGSSLFSRTGLRSFTFPEWLKDIPEYMFYCCYSINFKTLPQGLLTIGRAAFQATACTFTEIPDSVVSIGSDAFVGIPSTSLTIPSSVTSIGTHLLAGSASVATLRLRCNCVLPNGVITDSINKNSRLKYIEIGAIGIKQTAFNNCTGLLKVWIRDTCTTIEATGSSYPFNGNKSLVIYVEADSKPEGWADDFNRISPTASAPVTYGTKTSPF